MANRIQIRKDVAADWVSNNPVLALAEPGLETDTGNMKFGDGVTAWTGLGYTVIAKTPVINEAGQAYSLTDANFGAYTRFTSATAVTVTVDPDIDLTSDYKVATFRQAGAGTVTFVAGAGVTINGSLTMNGQNSNLQLIQVAANEYDELGGITP